MIVIIFNSGGDRKALNQAEVYIRIITCCCSITYLFVVVLLYFTAAGFAAIGMFAICYYFFCAPLM